MNLRLVFLCLFIGISSVNYAQTSPGGVAGPWLWLKTDTLGSIPVFHRIAVNGQDSVIKLTRGSLIKPFNFHPSVRLNGTDSVSLNMGDTSLNHCTLFTVYQPFDVSHENVIWHATKAGTTSLVMTTERAADLTTNSYMNFRDMQVGYPKIGIYSQQVADSIPVTHYWNIGYRPVTPQLPVVSLAGLLPEAIAYSRVLDADERLRVGSYLALKYGITLSDPGADYLNSQGDRIWLGSVYTDYHHHVAGIARDDASGLQQIKAESMEEPDMLIVTNRDTLANRTTLIWGDNNQPAKSDDAKPGLSPFLKKQWLFLPTGNGKTIFTDLEINTSVIDVALPDKPVYWLGIDSTSSPTPDAKTINLVRMSSLDKNGHAHFEALHWTGNASKMYVAVAGELLLKTAINGPVCGDPQNGSMDITIAGGVGPFSLTVVNSLNNQHLRQISSSARKLHFDKIASGAYTVIALDAMRNSYSQSFYVNSVDGPNPVSVADRYMLPAKGGCVTIHADSGVVTEATYKWSGPNGFNAAGPVVQLCNPGNYYLVITGDGCEVRKAIIVVGADSDTKLASMAWPNPSSGAYSFSITLPEREALSMTIVSEDGHVIDRKNGNGNESEYLFTGRIQHPGIYFFHFEAGKYHGVVKFDVVQ